MKLTLQRSTLPFISLVGLAGFAWPLLMPASPGEANMAAGWMAIALLPILAVVALMVTQGQLAGPRQIALLGILAALAAATRIATSGIGGFELIFVIVILGGAALGAQFGFLLGAVSILLSSLFFAGLGPWTAFQMFAVGWVGMGAGYLTHRFNTHNRFVLAGYAAASSYVFGLVMNLWFWPFAIGPTTSISYDSAAPFAQNFASFLVYSLASSTLTWDTVRAVSTSVAIALLAKPFIATLKRYRF
ncbi:MAG: hypothetical protein RL068_181 [Actinomycetota bacterium]|jgi:hypothetical protein